MIRAVVLDFDGVILESAQIKTEAFRALFQEICPERLKEALDCHLAHEGISRFVKFRMVYDDVLKQPLAPEQEQALGRRFEALVREAVLRAPLVAGAQEFLQSARTSGRYRIFVASGTPEEELRRIAEDRHLTGWAEEWHGSPRTKPEIIRDILSRHGWAPSDAVVVGDAVSDQAAAQATGVLFIGRAAGGTGRFAEGVPQIADLCQLPGLLGRVQPASYQHRGAR